MEHTVLYINNCGQGVVPVNWEQRPAIEMQRLYYIKGGSGCYDLPDGSCKSFLPGTFYLFPYNYRANFSSMRKDPLDHVYFDFISTPPIVSDMPLMLSADTGQMNSLRDFLTLVVPEHGKINSLTYRIVELVLAFWNQVQPLPFCSDRLVCDALDFIQKNYSQPITVAKLAERAHFEENHFIRRFRKQIGQTPYAYIKTFRLIRAQEFLKGGYSVTDTAALVGYENASSLSRALKGIAGQSHILVKKETECQLTT